MVHRQDIAFSLILLCGVVKLTPQGPRCPENFGTKPLKCYALPALTEY
jgi:hypothetical protein